MKINILIDEDGDLLLYTDDTKLRAAIRDILELAVKECDIRSWPASIRDFVRAERNAIQTYLDRDELEKAWEIYRAGMLDHHDAYLRGEGGWSWEVHTVEIPPEVKAQPITKEGKVTDFTVVVGMKAAEVSKDVSDLLKAGWELYGSPCLDGPYMAQSLIKKSYD